MDCSHGNSGKRQVNQEFVLRSILDQRMRPKDSIIGFMLESNLVEGNQLINDDPASLRYGVSITDECIGWETTERLIRYAHERLGGGSRRNAS